MYWSGCLVRAATLAFVLAVACAAPVAASESILYRLFLLDGTTLISYGEFARVADRVVFSIPVGESAESPNLQLISIPETRVDWDRTDRYSSAVRLQRYAETRGEDDFLQLGGRVAEALNQIALTKDPVRRLAMAREARGNLARWPAENFGYRTSDVAQLISMLDEVISELRVEAGLSSFDVSLVATTTPDPPLDLLPTPSLQETLQVAHAASASTSDPTERISLLRAIAVSLQERTRSGGWAAALYGRVTADLRSELRTEKRYHDLASSALTSAATLAARADVSRLQSLVQNVLKEDDRLGRRRPQETAALLASLDLRLDEARRLRLARDAWLVRNEAFKEYRNAIASAVDDLRRAKRPLENIRELAGPSPTVLPRLEQRLAAGTRLVGVIAPPAELEAAHGLFNAAFQMARRAVSTRRTAISSRDMKLAWDASSAAAGALMLLDRAAQELDRLTTPPTNR
jgi:hypothetical protein